MGCQEVQEKGDTATAPSFVALPTEATERQAAEAGTFLGETWQEVYRQILLADPESYLPAADADFDPQNRTVYLGLHDYDRDQIPELIIGDLSSGAVFTFREGRPKSWRTCTSPGWFGASTVSMPGATASASNAAAPAAPILSASDIWTANIFLAIIPRLATITTRR